MVADTNILSGLTSLSSLINGNQDFNQKSPLARTGGKAEICRQISASPETMVLIGDGKTDLEAQQIGVKVIGFGGVARRDIVEQQADFYVTEKSLMGVLKYIL